MAKDGKGAKQQKKKGGMGMRKTQKQRGAGWTDLVDPRHMISPGNQTHQAYPGPMQDCAGLPVRSGTIMGYQPNGLPGWGAAGGGKTQRRQRQHKQKQRGGLEVGPYPAVYRGVPIALKYSEADYGKTMQGGRWGSFPDLGPLNPVNAVGATSYAPIGRVPCEVGTRDALNPNPGGVQTMSTAVGWQPGWTPFRGGGCACGQGLRTGGGAVTRRRGQQRVQQRGGVQVGEVDAMRYYAPTAGYGNYPLEPQVQNNPGVLMQVGYPARHFNMACMKTN